MAVYNISGIANAYAEMKAAITNDTNLTLLNDDGQDDLTFSHSSLDIYVRLYNMDYSFPEIWIGDGWTSGANPDNQVKISSVGTSAFTGFWLVAANYMVFCFYTSATYCTYIVIDKAENGNVVCFGLNGTGNTFGIQVKGYNLTTLTALSPLFITGGTAIVGDKYLMSNIYMVDAGGLVLANLDGTPAKLLDFNCLMRSANVSTTNAGVIGTDLILYGAKDFIGTARDNFCVLGKGVYA